MKGKLIALRPVFPGQCNPTWMNELDNDHYYKFKNPAIGSFRRLPIEGERFRFIGDTEEDFRATSMVVSVEHISLTRIQFFTLNTVYGLEIANDEIFFDDIADEIDEAERDCN